MADAQTPVLTDDEIAAAVAPIYGNRVAAAMGRSDDIRTARLIERVVLDKIAAPSQPAPTMADALAAGDGTLHGAVDHWQEQALAGRAVMQQALDALRLLDEAFCANDYGTREGRNKGRKALIATRAAIAALSATMEKPNGK